MILGILDSIAADPSRNYKLDVMQSHMGNATLERVAFLAYDPFTQFYIRKIPVYSQTYKTTFGLDWALDELGKLSSRQLTGNAGIDHLTYVLSSVNSNDAQVIERIIGKDLKCGASEGTINKVWRDLIHDYPCMLASGYDEKLVTKIKWPAMAQLKMDGMRFNAIVKDSKCEFRTRNGKEVNLLGNLEQQFIALAAGQNLVFDGELVVLSEDGMSYLDRQTGNGILNKAVKGTITAKDATQVSATLWDIIPYEDFQNSISKLAYKNRFALLEAMHLDSGKIRLVSNQIVSSIEDARTLFEYYLAEGQEGIILKDSNGIWENKRSRGQIKFKGELDTSLIVTDIQEGTGKYIGMVGALVCESADSIIHVNVGTGMSDDVRKELWTDKPIGKIIAVKYNAKIQAKTGEWSLFLPVYCGVREDQTNADYFITIK